jgi:hypothetical protein
MVRKRLGIAQQKHPAISPEYEVTFMNGEVVVVAAGTPEVAQAVAEEDADLYGCRGRIVCYRQYQNQYQ